MKVKDLIERLNEMNPDLEVVVEVHTAAGIEEHGIKRADQAGNPNAGMVCLLDTKDDPNA